MKISGINYQEPHTSEADKVRSSSLSNRINNYKFSVFIGSAKTIPKEDKKKEGRKHNNMMQNGCVCVCI